MELNDAAYRTPDRRREHREDDRPELTVSAPNEGVEVHAMHTGRRRRKRQEPLTRRDGENMYGRSPSSCNRHLRRSRAMASTGNNKPQALVDAEMEMGLAQGSRVAEKAMRAVKKANAQVCFANLETARKEISLGLSRKKYKRLEADMFRSRIELANTLCEAEKDHQRHELEMKRVEEQTKELEVALRAADEVLRQLTADAKRKRRDAEDREASLRARLAASERRAEASEREHRNHKLFTWGTVARETERAACRERYRMAAFLQRYVVENEYLRLSKTKAEESASDLLERLRQTEGKLVKALAAPPAPLRGPEVMGMNNARQAAWATGMGRGGAGRGMGGVNGRGGRGPGGGAQGQGRGGEETYGRVAAAEDTLVKPSPPSVTQAEMAIRRLQGRAGGRDRSGGGDHGDGSNSDDGSSRPGGSRGGSCGRCRSQRVATASAQGELRRTRGLAAELSFLLSTTEGERDSLASLLVLAERRMDQLVVTQEELALSLAWKNVSVMEEQHMRLKREQQAEQQQRRQLQLQQQRGGGGGEYGGEGGVVAATANSSFASRRNGGPTATSKQDQQDSQGEQQLNEDSAALGSERRDTDDVCSPIEGPTGGDSAGAAAPTTASATSFEQTRTALETLELRRRVRELEVLQMAAEAGLREARTENRRLKNRCRGSPPAWVSWADGGGVVGSTAGEKEGRPVRRGSCSETAMTAIEARPPGRIGSEITRERPGGRHGRRGGGNEDDNDDSSGANGLEGRRSSQESGARPENGVSADCSVSLPLLSAAEIEGSRRGGGELAGERTGTAGAGAGRRSFSDVDQPLNWGWGGSSGAPPPRPEGRCRPRSSPFLRRAQRTNECTYWDRQQQWRHRHDQGLSREEEHGDAGSQGSGDLGECDDDGSLLIKGKLAWVLGLPAETTSENELLAEVMHLVVERGNASTDAGVLEAQLRKMDDQTLLISRLVASAADVSQIGGGGSRKGGRDHPSASSAAVVAGGRAGFRRGDGRSSSRGGLGFGDLRVGYSSDATFLSSLSHDDADNVTEAAVEGRHGPTAASGVGTTTRQKHARGAAATSPRDGPSSNTQGMAAGTAAAAAAVTGAAAPARPKKSILARGGGRGVPMPVSGEQGWATTAAENDRSSEPGGRNAAAVAGGVGPGGRKTALQEPDGGGTDQQPLDVDGTTRTSFSKTLQGRVVSIDVFCTKVISDVERRQQEEKNASNEREVQMDEIDYEIRVEAYDPAVLKHHVLHILDEHIKRCLSDHPHLYTLGAHRTRVHQSLVDRLIFMSEDDVRTERTQQGRGGAGGGDRSSDSGSGDDSRAGQDLPSSAPTPPASGGGAASSGVGARGERKRGERKQLLVLIGDAGEVITAEKPAGEGNTDGEAGGAVPIKRVHRHAKSAIMQIEKEEEVVEGVVYQYNPPMQEDIDPEQAKIARDLLMVESESSSQEGDDDDEDDEDSSEYDISDDEDDEEDDDEDDDEEDEEEDGEEEDDYQLLDEGDEEEEEEDEEDEED